MGTIGRALTWCMVAGAITLLGCEPSRHEVGDVGLRSGASHKDSVVRTQALDVVCLPEESPAPNTFCRYFQSTNEVELERCPRSLEQQLRDLANAHSFVETVDVATTHQNVEVLGIRIGKLTGPDDRPSPQVVYVSGQHGNEHLPVEMSMRVIRHFVTQYQDASSHEHALLQHATLTIVPVLNPDGYDRTWDASNNYSVLQRRVNGRDCGDGTFGVDLNRNHEFGWGESDQIVLGCGSPTSSGPFARSEPETIGIEELIFHAKDPRQAVLPGQYMTGVVANVHMSGGHTTLLAGIERTRQECSFSRAQGNNCVPPDLAVHGLTFGTQRPARALMYTATGNHTVPYDSGSRGIMMKYGWGGGLTGHIEYAAPERYDKRRIRAGLIELRPKEVCTPPPFYEPHVELAAVAADQVAVVTNLLTHVHALVEGAALSQQLGHGFALPYIHRRNPTSEHPGLRVGALVSIDTPGVSVAGQPIDLVPDITMPGVHYRTWRLPDDEHPYTYPDTLAVCTKGGQECPEVSFGEVLNLCDSTKWSVQGDWTFEPFQGGAAPADQCYWELPDRTTPAVVDHVLTRDPADLTTMEHARLIFSHHHEQNNLAQPAQQVRILVSNNGFKDCSRDETPGAQKCRIVEHLYEHKGDNREPSLSSGANFRTEILDVSDFDGLTGVQVRFDASRLGARTRIYDVHFAGWKQ